MKLYVVAVVVAVIGLWISSEVQAWETADAHAVWSPT